ncbi:YidC/Oxa1 family membrane protein insertase [Dethiobacter alkaliphilus]|uniref:60 kDa inner membrane insertion protein n=1 Tax=Dethiobacter alkaliphilus AHT 1 TaxID=555088 RepID=C0GI75_DETAL|nr:YidC/Oxa1 family membrane protein insertase [Dethiobacter alkaliphilus]EEG76923.1 60 kDa inner membrane insertion protein [Dethiobacter alkaliphilus AHT 1]
MGAIVDFLNEILMFFNNVTGNYGIAIILLTLLIRLVTWPLQNKQLTSAKAMQELQPELKKLQEKYKNDKEKLNQATMELWKEHKVNPAASCLPLLIQMPVLWAMFQVLRDQVTIADTMFLGMDMTVSVMDLRELGLLFAATSIGYYLLVIISGVTTFLQQKMMMSDKSQQAMMIMMPLMLLFFSLQFPAGLVLYWVVNNSLSIGQHFLINKNVKKGAVTE